MSNILAAISAQLPEELDVIFYCGMGLFKVGVILLFFFPWLAIQIVL